MIHLVLIRGKGLERHGTAGAEIFIPHTVVNFGLREGVFSCWGCLTLFSISIDSVYFE